MARKARDLSGMRFGRWVAIRFIPGSVASGVWGRWEVRCDCGTLRTIRPSLLTNGLSLSCGCRGKELAATRFSTHGMTNTPEFASWTAMRKRCKYVGHPKYAAYGGNGVTICPEWEDFAVFYRDMGPRLTGMTLDRIDNTKGYYPENCRWADKLTQAANRRNVQAAMLNGTSRTFNPDGSRKERKRPYKPRKRR